MEMSDFSWQEQKYAAPEMYVQYLPRNILENRKIVTCWEWLRKRELRNLESNLYLRVYRYNSRFLKIPAKLLLKVVFSKFTFNHSRRYDVLLV